MVATDRIENKLITIGLVKSKSERQMALDFIAEHYFKSFGTVPSPPQKIFVAKRKLEIVGTISLDFRNKNHSLPLEYIYKFDPKFFIEKEGIVQCGRWVSIVPNIALVLFYVAAIYALKKKMVYGLFEAKDIIVGLLNEQGIKTWILKEAIFQPSNVLENDRQYYLSCPLPKVYFIKWKQMKSVLEKDVLIKIKNGEIAI